MLVATWPLVRVVGTVTVRVVPSGRVTVAVTPWALLGPLLVMVTVTVTVCPGVAAPCGVSVMTTSATGVTARVAVAAFWFDPTFVTKAPAAIRFVTEPLVELVRTTVTVQLDAGGMTVPTGRLTKLASGVAVAAPPTQPAVVTEEGFALMTPLGYTSEKTLLNVADVDAFVLRIDIVSKVVPPTAIELLENTLVTIGLEGETLSESG